MDTGKIKQFFVRIYEKAFDEDIFSSSAQVGFYFLFALFPLLVFLVSIFGIVLGQNNEVRAEMFNYLRQLMPASAYELVYKTMNEVVEGSSGSKITFGLIATLYSASAGIESLRIALNDVYKLRETRAFWKRKLLSLAVTLGTGLMIFVALGIIFYGSQFINLILGKVGLPISSPLLLQFLSIIIVLMLLLITFDVLYYFVPDHNNLTWKWVTPGAVVTIALWLLFSKCFSLYLHYFDSYAKTYGSLGAMIVLMLWLYLTALVILIGGAINAVLDEFSRGQYVKLDIYKEQLTEEEKRELEKRNINVSNSQPKAEKQGEAKETGNEKKVIEPKIENPSKKTATKVVIGGIIASVIELLSFRKKR